MRYRANSLPMLLLLTCTLSPALSAASQQPPPQQAPVAPGAMSPSAPIEKVSANLFRLGEITIDKKERSITFPASVNMEKGRLEYLLVNEKGKLHESLLKTSVQPFDLQIASLLLNFKPTDTPLHYQGDPAAPKGEPVSITLTATGGKAGVDCKDWVVRMIDSSPRRIPEMRWVFTGSVVSQGILMAQMDGSMISLYHDPVTLIDNGTQGGDNDRIWFVNEGAVPPAGTPVTVTIQPLR